MADAELVLPTDDSMHENTGEVLAMIPLRNRRDGKVARIAEGMTEWCWGDGVGYGLSEYLHHRAE